MNKQSYSNVKIFHFKDNLDLLENKKDILAPINVRIKPTNICNHACHYCAYSEDNFEKFNKSHGQNRDIIPLDKMYEIIDDLNDMKVKAITFSGGGEPLSYPYMIDTLKKIIEDTDIKFGSLTNGSLLKGEIAKLFAKYGSWIRVSMDGWDNASYSKFRGVRDGEFTKIIKNLEDFVKLNGKCSLGLSYIISGDNIPYIYDIMKQLSDIGIQSVKLSPYLISSNLNESNKYHEQYFEKASSEINRAISDFSKYGLEIDNAYKKLDEKYEKDYDWCPFTQLLPIIGADQNIYTCPDKAYDLDKGLVGTIQDKTFKDFWYGDKNKFFDINPSRDCNHHCARNSKNKLILEYLNINKNHLDFL